MIKEYIEALLNTGLCSTKSEVLSHFQALGINAKCHEDLIQFKYDLISADWTKPLTHYCRGTIISWIGDDDTPDIKYVAIGFQKFFNHQEQFSKYKTEQSLEQFKLKDGKLSQKADGTCILLYFHNGWKCSTLGSIVPGTFGDEPKTFGDMFWELFDIDLNTVPKDGTHIFELCTENNQIVTKYDSNRLYYLGTTDPECVLEGIVYPHWRITDKIASKRSNILLPLSISLDDSVKTWDDFKVFAQNNFTKDMGKNPEGIVGTINGKPVFKYKFPDYLILHKTMTGDDKYVKKSLIKRIFEGTIDDVISELTDNQKDFCARVVDKIVDITMEYSNAIYDLAKSSYELPRDYAAAVEVIASTLKNKEFKGYLYAHRKTNSLLIEWLKEDVGDKPRYHKYIDFFKTV